jgi:hypothetical protein
VTAGAREVGLRYARANVLLATGGEVAGLYRLATVNYPMLAVGDKWLVQQRLERLARVIGADFSLWRVTRGAGTAPSAEASHTTEVYLAVSLRPTPRHALAAMLTASGDRLRARLEALLGRWPAAITGRGLAAMAQAEASTFERVRAVLALRRARTRELEWLLRRATVRGAGEPHLEHFWQPDALVIDSEGEARYEPLGCDVWRLAAAPLREDPERPPSLEVEAEEATSYQAMLCLGTLADETLFPGPAELLHAPLEAVGFAVDAVLHARWVANRDALGQVRRRIVDAEQVYRDQLESRHGPAWRAEDDRTLAREYEQVLQSSARPGMLYATISLAVGADSRDELERRVQTLRAAYGDVALFRPRGLQERLFFDHLPRADGGRVADYRQQLTAQQFGAMVPTATTLVGDRGGHEIGHTTAGPRRLVRYDPTAPPRESRASAVLLAGTLGSGKSMAAQLIAYRAARAGSVVVDFDPKPDHGFTNVAALDGQVEVIELTGAEAQRGALDPLAIGVGDLREELAVSYLLELVRDPPASWEHAIARAVRDAARDGGGCLQAIRILRAFEAPAGREVADALEVVADLGLARLGFADVTEGASLEAGLGGAVTTVRAPGLTLPEPGVARETYTRAERVSVATLSLVAALALRLVSAERVRHKVVILDEAWFLLASAQGRALVNRLVRLARAYNATVLLVTQRLDDVEGISDLVGTWFMFGQDSDTEATRALELLGVEPTPSRVSRLREARGGRCLMRDLHGRVAEIQIDPADPELLQAFDTTPAAAGASS